jgi:hypothetical protein
LLKDRKEYHQRINWLFHLQAETGGGHRNLADLCGFAWDAEKVLYNHEETFKDNSDDRGKMPSEDFRRNYLGITPDFRCWTSDQHQQLIIEAKGTPKPIGQKERIQAQRYFTYLRDSGYKGAIVYFAPNPKQWLDWLTEIGGHSGHPFGVVDWTVQVVPQIANELLHVVAESLGQTADLLKTALQLSKTVPPNEI